MKIHGFRYQLIGDMVSALPLLHYCEKRYPGSFKSWGVAKKVSQSAPLFLNHPLINQLFIFDGTEGPESKRDFDFVQSHDIIFNGNPQHPDNVFPGSGTIYSETWRMAGLPIEEWNLLTEEERRPKLYKWWNEELPQERTRKVVAYWPGASYGREAKRHSSYQWYDTFLWELRKAGFIVWQFGHPNDHKPEYLENENSFMNYNSLPFFEQIKKTLTADLMIGTDSGSSLVVAAYQTLPQITLLTNHWPGIERNHMALAPDSLQNFNFFGLDSADRIEINEVVAKAKELTR